jgi:hypothetical protein
VNGVINNPYMKDEKLLLSITEIENQLQMLKGMAISLPFSFLLNQTIEAVRLLQEQNRALDAQFKAAISRECQLLHERNQLENRVAYLETSSS